MKLTESQLRNIVRQELKRLHESTGEVEEVVDASNFGHLEIGNTYSVAGMPGKHEFIDWVDESGESVPADLPAEETLLKFLDLKHNEEWEAYYFNGRFCWGSSADKLVVKESPSVSGNSREMPKVNIDLGSLAKRAVNMINLKYAGKIHRAPSGEIENELISYLESVGLMGRDLDEASNNALQELEWIHQMSF